MKPIPDSPMPLALNTLRWKSASLHWYHPPFLISSLVQVSNSKYLLIYFLALYFKFGVFLLCLQNKSMCLIFQQNSYNSKNPPPKHFNLLACFTKPMSLLFPSSRLRLHFYTKYWIRPLSERLLCVFPK